VHEEAAARLSTLLAAQTPSSSAPRRNGSSAWANHLHGGIERDRQVEWTPEWGRRIAGMVRTARTGASSQRVKCRFPVRAQEAANCTGQRSHIEGIARRVKSGIEAWYERSGRAARRPLIMKASDTLDVWFDSA
jgi:isoleucyl-tRNA synthetase